MKVLLLIHRPQARGQEIFAAQLGNHLIKEGHEVVMASVYSGDFDLGFKGRFIHLNLLSSLATFFPSNWKKLANLIQDFDPKVIQANGGDTLKYAALTRMLYPFSNKLIFNNGGVLSFYLKSGFKRKLYLFLLRKVDGACAVSQHAATDLAKFVPHTCPQVQIPIAVHTHQVFNLPQSPGFQVFVHIAGFSYEKNHEELILIFAEYLKTDPKAQLWMMGEGPLRKKMEYLADSLSPESFRFFGEVKDPWIYVPQHAILLLPSLIEGMPAVLVEAMLAKIPVIAYEVGGVAELARDFPSIKGVKAGDKNAFLKEMQSLAAADFKSLQSDLEISRQEAMGRFDLDKSAQKFLNFYRTVCG